MSVDHHQNGLVVEIRHPQELWLGSFAKAVKHLQTGTPVVGLLDLPTRTLSIFQADKLPVVLSVGDQLKLRNVLGAAQNRVTEFLGESR